MSNHLINIHDERLARLYFLAEQRHLDYELDTGFAAMWVDSFSNPENTYYMSIKDEEVKCHCKAALAGQACTHAAVYVAHFYPSIWLKWFSDECAEFLKLRHKIITNARLTLSEKRKVNRAIREREEERMDNSVLVRTSTTGEKVRGITI